MADDAAVAATYPSIEEGLAAAEAARQQSPDAALPILAALRDQYPRDPRPIQLATIILRDAGRRDEVDKWLTLGRERMPDELSFVAAHAWVAHERKDFHEAVRRWAVLREIQPEAATGWVVGAYALRDLGRLDEAEDLLRDAIDRFPDDPVPLAEVAWIASHRHDWEEGDRRFAHVREQFPGHIPGYIGGALMLRELGRAGDAEAVLAEGLAALPDNVMLLTEHARIAMHRRAWSDAADRWEIVGRMRPDEREPYRAAALAWREAGEPDTADEILTKAVERFPDDVGLRTEHAWLAQGRQDWPAAAARWAAVRAEHPDNLHAYTAAAQALGGAGRVEEAEALLAEAIERFPEERSLLHQYASLATQRRDWPEAMRRWDMVIDRDPESPDGYGGKAFAFRASGRGEESEATVLEAMRRFPDNANLASDYAWAAFSRPEEALQRWRTVRERFPRHVIAYSGMAIALRALERYDEAEDVSAEALRAFPGQGGPMLDYATTAAVRRNWDAALERWDAFRRLFPDQSAGYIGAIQAMSELGEIDEAKALAEDGLSRFPNDAKLHHLFGDVAVRRGDLEVARERLSQAAQRFPDDQDISRALHDVRAQTGGDAEEAGPEPTAEIEMPLQPESEPSATAAEPVMVEADATRVTEPVTSTEVKEPPATPKPAAVPRWRRLAQSFFSTEPRSR